MHGGTVAFARGPVSAFVGRIHPSVLISGAVAVVVFWLAYDDASYGLPARATIAIIVWWAVILGIALQLFGPFVSRARRSSWAASRGLACWTLASILWAPSAEDAFNELNRVSLYLGVYVLVVLASTRGTVGRWATGWRSPSQRSRSSRSSSRLFPGSFSDRGLATFLPSAVTRLSFPLGYWNGLAIFIALGLPLLLRVALVARNTVVAALRSRRSRLIASVVYLASSRGGVLTAARGRGGVPGARRTALERARGVAIGAAGSAFAIAALLARDELVNGPLGTGTVESQGRSAALLIALCCAGTAGRVRARMPVPLRSVERSPAAGRIVAGAAALRAFVAVVASDPVSRFDTFRDAASRARGDRTRTTSSPPIC